MSNNSTTPSNYYWVSLINKYGNFTKAVSVLKEVVTREPQPKNTINIKKALHILSLLEQITPPKTQEMEIIVEKRQKYYYWLDDDEEYVPTNLINEKVI